MMDTVTSKYSLHFKIIVVLDFFNIHLNIHLIYFFANILSKILIQIYKSISHILILFKNKTNHYKIYDKFVF
jgi:hypothetical protein